MAGKPSMMALLGLIAAAGFKNKDKISDMIAGMGGNTNPAGSGAGGRPGVQTDSSVSSGRSGSLLTELSSVFAGGGAASVLSKGLSELVDQFKNSGQREAAESWVGKGANRELQESALESSLGADVIKELSEKTGLSRSELLARLSSNIPGAVDRFSPEGRLPTEQEAEKYS